MAITRLGPNQDITAAKIAGQINFKNLIINGDMSIAQRGTSTSGVTTTDGYYACDRWRSQTDIGTWTISQSTDVPTGQGFVNSFKMDCTSAGTSNADEVSIRQKIEGQFLQYLAYGTSSAKSLTISFWIKSNKTGDYTISFNNVNSTQERLAGYNYTIDTANTWEKKTFTLTGDSSYGFDNTNGTELELYWWFSAASAFRTGTVSNTWQNYNAANHAISTLAGLGGSTSDYVNITGVQLEADTAASDFEFLPYDVNLRRCQRYYENHTANGSVNIGHAYNTTQARTYFQYRVKKRAAPTITLATAGNGDGEISFLTKGGAYVGTIGTHTAINVAIDRFNISVNSGTYSSTGWVEGDALFFYVNGNNYVIWEADAEL